MQGDSLVDIPFPKGVRDELVTAGRAEPHHILPHSGWVSIYLKEASDVERVIELLPLSFEIANQKISKQGKAVRRPVLSYGSPRYASGKSAFEA
jgi:hypothetical protein